MKSAFLEKFGSGGAFIAAAACPICFPKLALIGAVLGLGVLAPYEGYIAIAVQALFALALVGQLIAYPRHRNRWLLSLSVASTALLFGAYHGFGSPLLLQLALLGMVVASVWLVIESRRCATCAAPAKAEEPAR